MDATNMNQIRFRPVLPHPSPGRGIITAPAPQEISEMTKIRQNAAIWPARSRDDTLPLQWILGHGSKTYLIHGQGNSTVTWEKESDPSDNFEWSFASSQS